MINRLTPNRTTITTGFLFLLMLLPLLPAQNLSAANILIPPSPSIRASSYLLQDSDSGQILAEKNADVRLAPASLTKIMTVYVVFRELKNGHLSLDETTIISEKAWRTPGSRMFIEVNKHIAVKDLLKGIIIQSGNDASVAIAEHVAGDERTFADLMNQHAERLGMLNSHFINSTGLPSQDHFTTAHDMAIVSKALINEFPDLYAWFKVKEFTFNNITQKNRNALLWRDESVDGIKTGYTEDAGYCLVASAKRDDMRLISIVMGTDSVKTRTAENQSLLNYGFRFFKTYPLYKANVSLTQTKIWKGNTENLDLGLSEDLYVTVPRRHYKDLNAVMTFDKKIIAPVTKGQTFGTVNVNLGDQSIAKLPLIALKSVSEGGFFQKLFDEALLRIQ